MAIEPQVEKDKAPGGLRWSIILTSVIFLITSFVMSGLYGTVHWQILFQLRFDEKLSRDATLDMLGQLWWLRIIFATLALIWAVWALKYGPRWAAMVAIALAIMTLVMSVVVMT